VRTEFAFLSGIGEGTLGVHRFNPYRAIAAGREVFSLASCLKRLGYRTVCVHPYPASFYRRDRAYPRLGFDEFLDIRAFGGATRVGPYIGDLAVADQIEAILLEARSPLFIFAITMENHGPLHLERAGPSDMDDLYTRPPPAGCDELTIYLRHLRNADRMISRLCATLGQCEHPANLCWFGDHVPIMSAVYEIFGSPCGRVEYVFWSNQGAGCAKEREIHVHDLALDWLRMAGVMPGISSGRRP
jgi:phosphoglycerol transferase MdoB-like AlkP superfamily enzyme